MVPPLVDELDELRPCCLAWEDHVRLDVFIVEGSVPRIFRHGIHG